MNDLAYSFLVIVISLTLAARLAQKLPPIEGRYIVWGLLAHVTGAIAQVVITEYYYNGVGDLMAYWRQGVPAAEVMRTDPTNWIPEYVKMFLHQAAIIPTGFEGSATTASTGAVGAIILFFVGNSLYATCLVIATCSFLGKFAVYRVIRDEVAAPLRPRILAGIMFLPTAVFWSAGLLKESIVIGALGAVMAGAATIIRKRRFVGGAVIGIPGVIFIAMIKPYILVAGSVAVAAWAYLHFARSAGRVVNFRLSYIIVGAIIATGVLAGAGRLFPEFELGAVEKRTAELQHNGTMVEGGSNYTLGGSVQEESLSGRAALAPIALFTALFRPTLPEVRNAMTLFAALENTYLLVLAFRLLRKGQLRTHLNLIAKSPVLAFAVVFVFVLGTAVGLASTNLGSLSRYRAPMMPFLITALFFLLESAKSSALRPVVAAPARSRAGAVG